MRCDVQFPTCFISADATCSVNLQAAMELPWCMFSSSFSRNQRPPCPFSRYITRTWMQQAPWERRTQGAQAGPLALGLQRPGFKSQCGQSSVSSPAEAAHAHCSAYCRIAGGNEHVFSVAPKIQSVLNKHRPSLH